MFFHWLGQIRSILRVEGRGDAILLHVSSKRVSENNLRELIAMFRRYKISMAQLAQFENDSNREWFRNPKAFWYHAIFKTSPPDHRTQAPIQDSRLHHRSANRLSLRAPSG
ncbi:MAG: hypothetical protein EOO73_35755 [Myxococcales bacterium]|nr:MAG: hypothetical protein EOO73_35755 [Myxococcales bacterium]